MVIKLLTMILPWRLRRLALNKWVGFHIHPTARIGLAWVFPAKLIMGPNTRIDHFTVAIHLDCIEMEENATIGRSNWITGFETGSSSLHFRHQHDRRATLLMGKDSAITKNHHIDCTNMIKIGAFTTIAGYQSQLLTHSIDVYESRQHSAPITIGDYCFVGTNTVILGGSVLPSRSMLGAKSLLNKVYSKEWCLYAGVPAKEVAEIEQTAKYFSRNEGFIY